MRILVILSFVVGAVLANANSREALRSKNKESRIQQRKDVEAIVDDTRQENDSLRGEMRSADSPEERRELHSEIKENRKEAKEKIQGVRQEGRAERVENRKAAKESHRKGRH